MPQPLSLQALTTELASLPNARQLGAAVRDRALQAARARDVTFLAPSGPGMADGVRRTAEATGPETLSRELAETPFGNVSDMLDRGVQDPDGRAIISAWLALGIAHCPQDLEDAQTLTVAQLVWLTTHTSCNPFGALDNLIDERRATDLYRAVAEIAVGSLRPSSFGRPEALTAAMLLAHSDTEAAARAAESAAYAAADPLIRLALEHRAQHSEGLHGELTSAPRGIAITLLLAVTLLLLVVHVGRLVARFALGYKRPARVLLTPEGLSISWRTELLGRSLRERSTLLPTAALARITREVRYARAGLYVGLGALVLGTFVGVSLLVDGLRVPGGSGPLLVLAALCLLAGIGLDFVLSSFSDAVRGSCRLVVVPRRGRPLCLRSLSPRATDALLESVARDMGRVHAPTGSPC
ncbi:MAG: hypothetical protein JW940_15270 [Polyangiaceae bacterium]|nr:hypothetical protein [Polyangiaceae bacterium]